MTHANLTVINFCPTGMVPTKAMTPHVPISVQEIVEEVHEAYELGITIAHLHARDEQGVPTHLKSVNQNIFEGIRKYCPELIICASSSGRLVQDFESRSEVIELKPDMCSLTLSSLNFMLSASVNSPDMITQLLEKMNKYGVIPELECFDLGMINYGNYLIEKGHIKGLKYWNLLFGNIAGMQSDFATLASAISQIKQDEKTIISFGGLGSHQLKINQSAILNNYGIRIGLEDNIWFDEKRTKLAKNMDLLKRIHNIMEINEKRVYPSSDFRNNYIG
jgi:uncharacterized protein (DUF849 family)